MGWIKGAAGEVRWRGVVGKVGFPLMREWTLLEDANDEYCVYALAVRKGRLISGHASDKLRVWILAARQCEQVLEGHGNVMRVLAACGSRLASGGDGNLKVWGVGAGAAWAWERTLLHQQWDATGSPTESLAGWHHRLTSGSYDGRIWASRALPS